MLRHWDYPLLLLRNPPPPSEEASFLLWEGKSPSADRAFRFPNHVTKVSAEAKGQPIEVALDHPAPAELVQTRRLN